MHYYTGMQVCIYMAIDIRSMHKIARDREPTSNISLGSPVMRYSFSDVTRQNPCCSDRRGTDGAPLRLTGPQFPAADAASVLSQGDNDLGAEVT